MHDQLVVVCDLKEETVYDSCYGRDEAKEVAKACTERYGPKSNPRVLIAQKYMASHPIQG